MDMSKQYYDILGLDKSASDEEIKLRYEQLVEKYREERWQDGEIGNEAAKMLSRVEIAYQEIMSSRKEQDRNTEGANSYEEVAELLKKGEISAAQAKLDDFNERPAEWHYLQAVVFFKKNWTNESKKQLEIAMQLDPSNDKYRSAYEKLNRKNDYEKQSAQQPYNGDYNMSGQGEQMGGNACSNCISCCYTYLCVDCLFSLCCGCR